MAAQTSFSKLSNEELCSLIRVKEIIDMFFKDACQKQIETSVMKLSIKSHIKLKMVLTVLSKIMKSHIQL